MSNVGDERRLQLLVETIRDYAIIMLDPKGVVATWNVGAERIKGHSPGEVIGKHFSLFYSEEDRRAGLPEKALASALKNGRFQTEGWRYRKDGSRFWALVVVQTIFDEKNQLVGFAKITRDITERRAAEQALIDSERRFRLLVQGVVDYAIFMLDPSGVVTNWNTGAERIKGYHADEIVGRHFSVFYTRDDRMSGLPARALETAQREGRFEAEGWRLRKDGGRFWASVVIDAIYDENGVLIGYAKITRDITERREAQLAVQESERQFRLLVSGVTDYSIFMLDPNGIITNWNAGAERIKGYSAEEIVGQHFSRFYTEGDRMAGVPARAIMTAAKEGRYEAEGWRVRKDGRFFWASVVIDAIRDDNGVLVGFAKITRDITERREAQLTLEKAQKQLAQRQKMESLGQLTGGVAHDFNNLLMIVGGYISRLKKMVASDPKGLRAAEAIETATKRGVSLTRQLLSFSRQQRLSPVAVNLETELIQFRDMVASSLGNNVTLVTQVTPGVSPIAVDISELELALVNVAVNARDAMPGGGVITVTAEDAVLRAGDSPDGLTGEFVAISVSDTGTGIAPDVLPKIFDPFFTTKPVDKGSGLGLSQVYGFAQQSGGTVIVSSEVGRGTTFRIYLPKAGETTVLLTRAEESDVVPSGVGSILLVEDNPEVAEAGADLLDELGYSVRIVNNADAALEMLGSGEHFDLLFSDIVMAGTFDGVGLARRVRKDYPQLPIILATGFTRNLESSSLEFPLLRKPYTIADLGRAVANVIGESRQQGSESNLVDLQDARKAQAAKNERK